MREVLSHSGADSINRLADGKRKLLRSSDSARAHQHQVWLARKIADAKEKITSCGSAELRDAIKMFQMRRAETNESSANDRYTRVAESKPMDDAEVRPYSARL